MATNELMIVLKARDEATKTLQEAGKGLGQLQKQVKAVGTAMTVAGAVMVGFAAVTVKAAAEFQGKMKEVNSLLNLTDLEFKALSRQTLKMSSAMGIDGVDAANALYQAISAGVPKENVIEFLEIAAKTAIAGVTDTETAVDGLTSVLNAFGMPMSEAQRVADVMFTTIKGGKTTFEELAAAMFQIAPLAAAVGIPFEEVAAATATLTKAGTPTSTAMTQIRAAVVSLVKPTVEMERILLNLGYGSGVALLEARGLQGGLEAVATESGATAKELTKALGSTESMSAVFALTGENYATAVEDMEQSYNSAGAATEAYEIINASASRQFEILTTRLKTASTQST